MTRHIRRASSVRLAPTRTKPRAALTAICPTRQSALSTDSLARNKRLVYRCDLKAHLTNTYVSAVSLARVAHREAGSDCASSRLRRLALPGTRVRSRRRSPAAISPKIATVAAAAFKVTPFGHRGGR